MQGYLRWRAQIGGTGARLHPAKDVILLIIITQYLRSVANLESHTRKWPFGQYRL